MNSIGGISSYTSITAGESAISGAKLSSEKGKFEELVRSISNSSGAGSNLSSSQVVQEGRLNGDYKTGFAGSFNSSNLNTDILSSIAYSFKDFFSFSSE